MNIHWLGHYTIKITTQGLTVLLDPHDASTGLNPVRTKADIVSLSNPDGEHMSYLGPGTKDSVIISSPGEYSFKDISMTAAGWHDSQRHEHNIQRWDIEGISLLHIGEVDPKLAAEKLAELEQTSTDILLLPIGGAGSLSTSEAHDLLGLIEPRIVIPIHFFTDKLKYKAEKVDQFARDMGVDPKTRESKLSINRKKLPAEGIQTVILTPL